MSKETMQWLNTMTLIGQTDQRGRAWHYRTEHQGTEDNHYRGFIPPAEVVRRLLAWEAISRPVTVTIPADIATATGIDDSGNAVRSIIVPNAQAIVADDDGTVFGIFSEGYRIHQFQTEGLDNMRKILGEDVGIASAGLLANRGIFWVEASIPETMRGPAGITIRPNLLFCTSHTGKLATTWKRTVTNTVCDNTMRAALGEDGETYKVKHSSRSMGRLTDVHAALNIIRETATEFLSGASVLVDRKISRLEFKTVISSMVPVTPDMSKNATTIAENKRAAITALYTSDPRVAPWTGTAWGVLQAFNTWEHHAKNVKGAGDYANAARAERNMMSALNGDTDKADAAVLAVLAGI